MLWHGVNRIVLKQIGDSSRDATSVRVYLNAAKTYVLLQPHYEEPHISSP